MYYPNQEKLQDMYDELRKDNLLKGTNRNLFESLFLVDDFTASGTSFARKEDNKFKGKIIKVLRGMKPKEAGSEGSADDESKELSDLFVKGQVKVSVLFCVATEEAITNIKREVGKYLSDNGMNDLIQFNVDCVQLIKTEEINLIKISPAAFWQVNHDGAEILYRTAAEKAGLTGEETVADLYCGTGSIGLSMSHKAKKITGIEIVPEAVECAKENAAANGIENAEFYCADASDIRSIGDKLDADVVIIDPPRKGSTRELIAAIAERGVKRIVYVSCAPDTLARDCAEFYKHGYRISGEVTPVDMFPRTGHCEVVVSLTRNFAAI